MDTTHAGPHNVELHEDVRLTYCYICNAQIYTKKPQDWDEIQQKEPEKARDISPVTCGSSDCLEQYHKLPKPRVPFHTAPHLDLVEYDGGPFLDFAVRNKREEMLDKIDPLTHTAISQDYMFENAHKLEPLFQAWFFFGLLQEFLGPLYRKEDFLDDDGRIITTERLQDILTRWTGREDASKATENTNSAGLHAYLRFTGSTLTMTRFSFQGRASTFDQNLLDLLLLTGAMLEEAYVRRFSADVDSRAGFTPRDKSHLVDQAVERGWCPFEAKDAADNSFQLCQLMFIFNFELGSSKAQHDACTSTECSLLRADPERVTVPLHVEEGCTCEEVGPNELQMKRVQDILHRQRIPVIRLERKENGVLKLEIIEASANSPYVAISHVWRQGMGNSFANRIRQCQLDRLYDHIGSLEEIVAPGATDKSLYLWLDTLCCPVTPASAREAAILLMRETYEQASNVLVLDDDILKFNMEQISPLEVAARLSFIQWTRRLWTLQESFLAQQLWFKCSGSFINARSLWLALRDIYRGPDPIASLLAVSAISSVHQMRCHGKANLQHLSTHIKMHTVGSALSSRSVTNPDDEPLCIANILGLDLAQILEVPKQDRMKLLWQLMAEAKLLTRGILFYSGSKSSEVGFRWAPSTLLQLESKAGLLGEKSVPTANMTRHGLQVYSSGIRLQVPGSRAGLNVDLLDLHDEVGLTALCKSYGKESTYEMPSIVSLRDTDGQWLYLVSMDDASAIHNSKDLQRSQKALWRQLTFSPGDFGLIQVKPGPLFEINRDRRALLVRIESTNGEICCTPLAMVSTALYNAIWTRIIERISIMADKIRQEVNEQTPVDKIHQVLSDGIESSLLAMADELDEADRVAAASYEWSAEVLRSYLNSASSFQEDLAVIGGSKGFRRVLNYAVAGRYAVVKEYLPENQSWVVD